MDASDALASYRQRNSSEGMDKALESFHALSLQDQMELLFWISMSTNNIILPIMQRMGVKVDINKMPAKVS